MPQLCSYLFAAAKHAATQALGTRVHKAVLTVPVTFDDARIRAMRRAARLAHLEIMDVIEEPTAAALANRGDQRFDGVVGVYDFGGGTFDFSLVEAHGGDLRVLATAGDSWLGGDDFDIALADAVANACWRAHDIDLHGRAVEWQYLVHSCEQAKRSLSVEAHAQVVVPEALRDRRGARDLRMKLSRDRVEPLWREAIGRSVSTCDQALALAGVPRSSLRAVYLSGGTSFIPAVRRRLQAAFQAPILPGISPQHAVCAGAGIHAAQIERSMPRSLQ
jgi:molecular chaperone DnaK